MTRTSELACAEQEAKQRSAAAQKAEEQGMVAAEQPTGAPADKQPSLLKLLAASSKEPSTKGALAQAVRNLVREVGSSNECL